MVLLVMTKDEILAFLVENGALSIPWQQPKTVRDPKPATPPRPKSKAPYPLIQYRKGLISKSELCKALGIKEKDLFRYLVDNGLVFDFH